ncbi:MAG: trigger factor [Clostridia bacterium]|nr:trigger factor [Clostridia bacterium]
MYKLKKENAKVEIDLTVDAQEWEKGVQQVYEANKGKFAVEGFRKGKVPRKVIEKTYGDGVFFEDTVEFFVNKALNDVLTENDDLEPVAMPTTQFESFTADKGLKMKIFFEIVPDFELCAYKDQTFKVHSNEVTEEDINHEIKHLLDDNAKFETVEREVKNGDSAVIDFVGSIDGVEFEGGAGQDYPLEIGSHSFIDTFEDQLIGHKKGDVVDVNVTFPENYQALEFAGKKALFKVTIKEVREKFLPELNDKFVADTTEFETVEAYKNSIKEHIQSMKDKQMENEFQFKVREYLLENTKVEIPEIMVENAVHEDLHRLENALKQYNVTVEDYLKQTGSDLQAYKENAKERHLHMIKTRYVYRKLIEENKIEVTADELKNATKGLKDSNAILRIENELLLDKLHAFLKENNKIEFEK